MHAGTCGPSPPDTPKRLDALLLATPLIAAKVIAESSFVFSSHPKL
jgi:hypothetical protein